MKAALRWTRLLPEAGRCWIAHAPRVWSSSDRPWLDLATGGLEPARTQTAPPAVEDWPGEPPDLLYLPPVAIGHRAARDAVVADAAATGLPCLVQVVVGEPAPRTARLVLVDLTGVLLADEPGRLAEVPSGCHVVWPLIPGIGDPEELVDSGLRRLAAAGVQSVRGVAPEISPTFRQKLAAGRPAEVFDALFRGPALDEPDFAARAAAHGLGLWPPRPIPVGVSARETGNRRVAAALAEAAELWQRLGRSAAEAQLLWRAARDAETTSYDLVALDRDGNLNVLEWLDARGLAVASSAARGEEPRLLVELRAAYVGAC